MITFILLILLSLDTFMVGLSYECDKIKIPISSNIAISTICSLSLIFSLILSNLIKNFIPQTTIKYLSFSILFFIGIFKIYNYKIKNYLKTISIKNTLVNFIIKIYSDYHKADKDNSKTLSLTESIFLALVLSLDTLVTVPALNINHNITTLFFISLFINTTSLSLAHFLGKKLKNINFSIIGGLIFIIIAFFKLK